jgi:hypothetical protein
VKTYQDCALYWDVYIICNILILYLINCVTTKNETIDMFMSLGSEVANFVEFCLEELSECL